MEKTGGSRLLQMQIERTKRVARFQQKQLHEKELKIASLYEAQQARALDRVRNTPSNGTASSTNTPASVSPGSHPPGKVRQMFEERRTKAGIDKSYPLQPIHNTEKPQPRKAIPNGYTKVANTTSKTAIEKKTSVRQLGTFSSHSVKKNITQVQKVNNNNIVNGTGDLNHNDDVNHNTVTELPKSNGYKTASTDKLDGVKAELNNKHDLLENETFPDGLAPDTPRSVEDVDTKKTVKKIPAQVSTKPNKLLPKTNAVPSKRTSSENVSESKPRGVMQKSNPVPRRTTASPVPSGGVRKPRTGVTSASKSGSVAGAGADGDACAICGRRFASDRLARHQDICRKTHAKKRKPFDVLKHRLAGTDAENNKGTEAEPFIGKLRKGTTASTTKVSKPINGNWRQKHEEFIQAIRAAKQVQAHLNAGGKLSDLPPPPPSENPDYVQCPHCNRRFNQGAAERHIPKCANFQFNKPKPPIRRR